MAAITDSMMPRPSLSTSLLCIGAFLACALFSKQGHAHVLSVGNASLNIVDQKAYLAMSVPVDVFSSIESCSDGVLTRAELNRDREKIVEAVHRGLTITAGTPATFSSVLLNLPTKYSEGSNHSEELLIMAVAPLASDGDLKVRWLYWSDTLEFLHFKAGRSQGSKLLSSQYAKLSESTPEILVLKSPLTTSLRWISRRVQALTARSVIGRAFR